MAIPSRRRATLALFATCALLLPAASPAVETFDDRLVRVERSLPGFGGLYFDDAGRLNVFVKAPDDTPRAVLDRWHPAVARALAAHFDPLAFTTGRERSPDPDAVLAELRLIPGRHSIRELVRLRRRANALFADGLALLTDVSERDNRVLVGVAEDALVPKAQARLAELGIPDDAVRVEVVARAALAATLQGDLPPKAGGLAAVIGAGPGACTHGFNALFRRRAGFVTNSHCTEKRFQPDPTTFAQKPGPVNVVADELIDPPLFPCIFGGVPFSCRFSDSVFAQYRRGEWPDKGFALGDVARPETRVFGGAAGSITIDPRRPFYRITGTFPAFFVGSTLDKVGQTTGHTTGVVWRTCVDELVAPSPTEVWIMLCQGEVNFAGVGNGDSGSPVFRWNASGNVTLAGLLWGSIPLGFRFSYFDLVQVELGPLQVY